MDKAILGKRFQGKVAIVTASTQGIGFTIAERLGLEGASVVISSRKQVHYGCPSISHFQLSFMGTSVSESKLMEERYIGVPFSVTVICLVWCVTFTSCPPYKSVVYFV